MPLQHLLVIYLIGILLVFLPSFGLAKLFTKAGEQSWKAFVPFYNTWVMQDIAKRPRHWVFWQFIPVVGWFITPGIFIEFAKVFGKYSLGHHTAAALLAPFYFPWLAAQKDTKFIGAEVAKKHKKAVWREWFDAAIFAIVAATLIRTFIFEAYVIPSGSMEKTLLVKDFLFVSKLSYGPRIPNTPLSVPFVHNYLPITNGKSYSTAIQLPYNRWFGSMPKRGDVVVFNFPEGDTVVHKEGFESAHPYYQLLRELGNWNEDQGRKRVLSDPDEYPLAIHPPDKSDNYIKRCVAVAGDVLQIINGDVFINGKKEIPPPHSERPYIIKLNGQALDHDIIKEDYNVDISNPQDFRILGVDSILITLTTEAAGKFSKAPFVKSMKPYLDNNSDNYAFSLFVVKNRWSTDEYGPIWIPKKNKSLPLNDSTYDIYQRAIRVYEKNDFYAKDGKFFLNGKEVNSYTFKMDYFWMIGDNRHGSQDSRFWGFVPEDRVVGKAWMIWFSWEGGPRWKRLFNIVK